MFGTSASYDAWSGSGQARMGLQLLTSAVAQTRDPGCHGNRVRCYGVSGDEIASIGRLLTERWLHRRRCKSRQWSHPRYAQAEEAAKAVQRPEPFAYTVRS